MTPTRPQLPRHRGIVACAMVLALGSVACPNTAWDGDAAKELERMHAPKALPGDEAAAEAEAELALDGRPAIEGAPLASDRR